jgi:hypothetical protein
VVALLSFFVTDWPLTVVALLLSFFLCDGLAAYEKRCTRPGTTLGTPPTSVQR